MLLALIVILMVLVLMLLMLAILRAPPRAGRPQPGRIAEGSRSLLLAHIAIIRTMESTVSIKALNGKRSCCRRLMMAGPALPAKVRQSAVQLGEHVVAWRKLQNLTANQVAERAGISRPTLRKLERGDASVGLDVMLMVLRALGQLDRLVEALDPYETDLGRARADWRLPNRVRP